MLGAMTVLLVVGLFSFGAAADFYVDQTNGGDSHYGLAWGDAFATIGRAIAACSSSVPSNVYVAEGTYFEALNLKSNVTLLGGYPAGGGSRDAEEYLTTLSGSGSARPLTFAGVSGCIVDGFEIRNGRSSVGGAIYCDHSSPTIEGCTIAGNRATEGGGIYLDGSSPDILNCKILENTAVSNGGGIYCDGSSPTIQDAIITDNEAGANGGGIFCDNSCPPDTKNCLIKSNVAGEYGGGVFCDNSSPVFLNCTFSLNEAGALGGALYLGSKCYPIVINSILWGDGPDEIWGHKSKKNSLDISYSNVQQDGFGDEDSPCDQDDNNNINCDPCFEAGDGRTEHDGYYLDQGYSPSISSGNTDENPYGGSSNPEYVTDVVGYLDMTSGDDVDMGYHYKTTGTPSYVKLLSFEAHGVGSQIIVTWETGTEIDNAGFYLFRTHEGAAEYRQLTGLIPAQGGAASGEAYRFVDGDVRLGVKYEYYLIDVEISGKWGVHGPAEARCVILTELNRRNGLVNLKAAELAEPM